jgi:phage baseplate assembly protein W
MAKPFLGVGTAFPPQLDPATQGFVRAQYEESVRQSILLILGTAPGERLMRPEFGCGIHDLVFANLSFGTLGRVQQTVDEALLRLEPRIDVTSIDVRSGGDGNVLLIHIQYQVRATNNAFNLVYPFYLQQDVPA